MTTLLLSERAAPDRAGVTVQLARYVRTEAGEEWFHEPIGSLIVKHTHHELLQMRTAMQMKYPRSDERVRKIRRAVDASRKQGHHLEPHRRFGEGETGAPQEKPALREQARRSKTDYRKLVEAFPSDSETQGIIDNAMQDVTDRGISEDRDPEAFWKAVHAQVTAELEARGTSERGVTIRRTESGNYRVAIGGKRIGIVIPNKDGTFDYEHRRGDHGTGVYRSLAEARDALVEREKSGRPVRGHRETMRDYGLRESPGLYGGSAGPERAPIQIPDRDPLVREYLWNEMLRENAVRKLNAQLDTQEKYVPDIVRNTRITLGDPGVPSPNPSVYTGGVSAQGDLITINPRVFTTHNKSLHPPTDDQYGVPAITLSHEIGHNVHRRLPSGGRDPELWSQLADAFHLPPPELLSTSVEEMRAGFPQDHLDNPDVKAIFDKITPESVNRANALMNTGAINQWIKSHEAALKQLVSLYGVSNTNELLAELWTEYTNSSNPRRSARVYGEYVKQHLMKEEFPPV